MRPCSWRACLRTAFTWSCSAQAARMTSRRWLPPCNWRSACSLPVVATHPVQFLAPEDFEAHEARVCIAEGEMLANPRRVRRFTREQYFKTSAEMQALFADVPSALANSVEIAKRCNLSLVLGKPQLPDFPIPPVNGVVMAADDYFRYASHEGLKERMAHLYPDAVEREAADAALSGAAGV